MDSTTRPKPPLEYIRVPSNITTVARKALVKPQETTTDPSGMLWKAVVEHVIDKKHPINPKLSSYKSLKQFLHFNQPTMDDCLMLDLSGLQQTTFPQRLQNV